MSLLANTIGTSARVISTINHWSMKASFNFVIRVHQAALISLSLITILFEACSTSTTVGSTRLNIHNITRDPNNFSKELIKVNSHSKMSGPGRKFNIEACQFASRKHSGGEWNSGGRVNFWKIAMPSFLFNRNANWIQKLKIAGPENLFPPSLQPQSIGCRCRCSQTCPTSGKHLINHQAQTATQLVELTASRRRRCYRFLLICVKTTN